MGLREQDRLNLIRELAMLGKGTEKPGSTKAKWEHTPPPPPGLFDQHRVPASAPTNAPSATDAPIPDADASDDDLPAASDLLAACDVIREAVRDVATQVIHQNRLLEDDTSTHKQVEAMKRAEVRIVTDVAALRTAIEAVFQVELATGSH